MAWRVVWIYSVSMRKEDVWVYGTGNEIQRKTSR